MISRTIDVTDQINGGTNYAIQDVGEWESLTIQAIGIAGTMTIAASNNAGEVTGSTNGGPRDAADFNAIQAVNLTTGATATAVTGTNLFRISPICFKYLRLGDGSSAAATKLLIHCTKPY